MHIIHKLKVGIDVPKKFVENEEKFVESLKKTTAKKLGLRPQDTQEVIIER